MNTQKCLSHVVCYCFVRVTSEVQRNADLLVGFLRFISTTISLKTEKTNTLSAQSKTLIYRIVLSF